MLTLTTKLDNGAHTDIVSFITDSSGLGKDGLLPTFVLKCAATSGPHLGMFYDFTANAWSSTPVENPLAEVTGIAGAYSFSFDQKDIGVDDDAYLVRVTSTISSNRPDDCLMFQYGDYVETSVKKLLAIQSPAREELHRVTNNIVDMIYFDSDDNQVCRFRVTHDPSGAQPEQIKEEQF